MMRQHKIIPAIMGMVPWVRKSLSMQLLTLTVMVVLVTEILIMIPSVANYHYNWLNMRGEAAYLVGFALKDESENRIDEMMLNEVFYYADILGATVVTDYGRVLIIAPEVKRPSERMKREIRLDGYKQTDRIKDAWSIMMSRNDNLIRVIKKSPVDGSPINDIVISESSLRKDLQAYAGNILLLSLLISGVTALFVYWFLNNLIISPVKNMRENMAAFEIDPENPVHVLQASNRVDEIGAAERDLGALEQRLQTLLNERRRLAALGAGISKISHDLRNILASAQLMSDRLMNSDDPRVRKLSPRLVDALDRAITLSRETLNYGKISPEILTLADVDFANIVEGVFDDNATTHVEMDSDIPDEFTVNIDRTQIYRSLTNLVRNAVEAMVDPADINEKPTEPVSVTSHRITISASRENGQSVIDIADNGPGVPEAAREFLYEPFKGSFKPGGSGLGIAISAEIIRAHGGDLVLHKSDDTGTTFRITLPDKQVSPTA